MEIVKSMQRLPRLGRMSRPIRACVGVMVWLSFEAVAAPVSGIDVLAGDPARLRLPPDSTRISLGSGMRIHGVALRAELFQTFASLRETADLIAGQLDTPPSLWVLPGAVLLAWQSGQHHWLARLTQPDETLTRGAVSVLTLPERSIQTLADRGAERNWLPAHARLLFAFDHAEGAQRVWQGIYAHDLPPARLWPHIHERLLRAGWHRESGESGHGDVERWASGAHRLTLLVTPLSGGSGMLATESEPL